MENFNLTMHGVLSMPNLDQSEKLVLIQFLTFKSIGVNQISRKVGHTQLNQSGPGWSKIVKRLMKMGYVYNSAHGRYSLNETNIY